jgi:hypothetical protein
MTMTETKKDYRCVCGHLPAQHHFTDPGPCGLCNCDCYEEEKLPDRPHDATLALKAGDTWEFSVEHPMSRWDLLCLLLNPKYRGVVWAKEKFTLTQIVVRSGVPEASISYNESTVQGE